MQLMRWLNMVRCSVKACTPFLCLYEFLSHPTWSVNCFPNTTHTHAKYM
jgi:hypothetical protein